MKVIIIGGVAAGMSAASKIKRMNKEANVVVYEKGNDLSYGACGLPYYVAGINEDPNKMIARTREAFENMGITIRTKAQVVKVDSEKKQVLVKDLENNRFYIDEYDKLMISTGCSTFVPPIKGRDLKNVYSLKTLQDGVILRNAILEQDIKKVVVVGGGYIGVEVAETFHETGKEVTLIELSPRILTPFDEEITDIAMDRINESGINLRLKEMVQEIQGDEYVHAVKTDKGLYEADLVVLAIGVRPATEFLKDSGVALAKNGAIIIDREMRTNVTDIYAAGDCAEVYSKIKEENAFIPLGTTANKCGRIAGGNILGKHDKYIGTLGSAAIKVLDLELARTGLSEKEAKDLSFDYSTVFVKSADHPAYYPNPTPIWIKVIYEKRSRRILGAQAIGNKGVVLRIDMFAIAIHNNMTTEEFGMTDLCYAPPFAGVWDAVHIACNAAK